jgi:ABC-type bacteriocin/lantibiotic exporter with double-glycine peptidase domain
MRTPFVQQLSADDCGASCLAMILAAHGVHHAAPVCRARCGAGRDGTRLRTLATVAREFGLATETVAVAAENFGQVKLPAIAHWQSRHFVVVDRWKPTRVTVIDPATGRTTLSAREFAESYTGAVLTLEPTPALVRTPKRRTPLWLDYFVSMFHDLSAQGALAQIVIASLLLQATGVAVPLFTKLIVDDVTPPGSTLSLSIVAMGMAIAVIGKSLMTLVRSTVMIRLQAQLDSRLTEGFFRHLLSLPFRFFQARNSGDLLIRLSSNAMIREILTSQLLAVLLDGPLAIVYLAILLTVAPKFGLLVVVAAGLQATVTLASLQSLRDLGQRSLASKSDEQSCLVELLKGMSHLKASGAEDRAFARWSQLFRRQLNVFVERSTYLAKLEVALGLLRTATPLALLWYGASLVLQGDLALGTMLALGALATSFLTPFLALVQSSQQLQLLDAYVERLVDVLEVEPERATTPRLVRHDSRDTNHSIEARGLTFRHSPDGPATIDDISFAVRPGESLGIVGPTGSGKSTILMLLLGLYEPTDGIVLYGGIPFRELDPHTTRKRCGIVMQDVALFAGTVRSNITLNAPDTPLERVVEAARLAGLDDDVRRMPLRYETRLAEGATNLSGGQRQRIAIARALVSRPDILLLDEATSHLDVASEQRVIANLEQLRCTRIVIAHRLTAVRNANHILVLDHGRVTEEGTHEDLVRRGGTYAALTEEQDPLASTRRPGTDPHPARTRRMDQHGHRGWRASI